MAYGDRQEGSSRFISIGIVVLVHLVLGYAFVTGLNPNIKSAIQDKLDVFDVLPPPPPPPPEPPPPPPPDTPPPPPQQQQVATPPRRVVTPSPTPYVVPPSPPAPQTVQQPIPPAPPAVVRIPPLAPVRPPPPPTPPPPVPKQAAKGASSPRGVPTNGDYPSSAERAGEAGTVRVSLSVSASGSVTNCSVTGSSGSSALDAATCRIFKSRTRYKPAEDTSGAKIASTVNTAVRWDIPK